MSLISIAEQKAYEGIQERVKKACKEAGHKDVHVLFSAYEYDEFDIPIDNLDDIPVKGKETFIDEGNEWACSGEYRPFLKIMDSPTWLEIAVAANEMILLTTNYHHVYLESVRFNDDGKVVFCMGS